MNIWLLATGVLLLALLPCAIVIFRAATLDRLVALELAGTITTLLILTLAQELGRPSICDLALALALLSLPGTLVYAYFLERWL
ncbi:MAG TPA: monovalent cation/H+ antiporter complex subunit F [Gemmataceae bacterium]|nr:monovalent cation/H+ antiporter complex subunit F [Gemmataceae bacterium]